MCAAISCTLCRHSLIWHWFCSLVEKQRSIRFQDEEKGEEDDEGEKTTTEVKPVTPLQAAMLKMAAEKAAKIHEESLQKAEEEEVCVLFNKLSVLYQRINVST